MKIKQYLHYYVGQQVRWHQADWEPDTFTPWQTLTYSTLHHLMTNGIIDDIELDLKQVSGLTDEECLEIAQMAIYKGMKPTIEPIIKRAGSEIHVQLHSGLYPESCRITDGYKDDTRGFYVYTYSDKGRTTGSCFQQATIVDYLTKKGFDLFGVMFLPK